MATKEYYLEKIKQYGIDKFDSLKDMDEEAIKGLHWMKLKDIVELYESQISGEKPMTDKEVKSSDTPNFADIIKKLQEDFEAKEKRFEDELRKIRDSVITEQKIVVQTPKDEVWGMKKNPSLTPGDFEKEPSTFLVVGRGFVTSTYYKDGVEQLAPYGSPVYFKLTNSTKMGSAHASSLLHISTYRTHSKKEKEWLRNHPLYGTTIHEKIKDIMTYDSSIANKIENAASTVNSLDAHQILAKANAYGLDVNLSLEQLKGRIITIEAQRMLEDDTKRQEYRLVKALEEKLVVKEQ